MKRSMNVRAAFILSIAMAWSLSMRAQQTGNSGNQPMPSQLSALLARANANANAGTSRKGSSVGQRAPKQASAPGGASSWEAGKTNFAPTSQLEGVWRDGSTSGAAPETPSSTIPGVSQPSGISLPSSTLASELSISKPADLPKPPDIEPAGLTQPASFKPPTSPSPMAALNTSSNVKHGGGRGGPSSGTEAGGRLGGMRSGSALAGGPLSRTSSLGRPGGMRSGSAPVGGPLSRTSSVGRPGGMGSGSVLGGGGGQAKVFGSRSGAPDFSARSMPGRAGAGGARRSAQTGAGGARRTSQAGAGGAKRSTQAGSGLTSQRGQTLGGRLSTLPEMEPASPVVHEIGTLPRTTTPDALP